MIPSRYTALGAGSRLFALAVSILCAASLAQAQTTGPARAASPPARSQLTSSQPVQFHVSGPAQRLEMIVNTSRILTLDYDVPRLLINNTDLIRATPLKANQIQISALKPGVTQLNIWDAQDNIHSLDVLVYGDARELQNLLENQFPEVSSLKVIPINSSVVISGYVPRPDTVSRIVRMAEDYYPKVHNNMNVGGAQTVLLHVKVMEVSRTKLRRCGIDWALLTGNDFVIQGASGLIAAAATQGGILTGGGETVRFGILDGGNAFGGLLDILKQNNLAKLLAEPTLVTVSGRPASFNSGGEIPVPVPAGLGVVSIQYREFGTQVDFVPIVLGNGMIRLEVRSLITDVDPSLAVAGAPGFSQRRVDTGVEMRAGQTLALAGMIKNRIDSEVRGIPWLSDLPWAGGAFRRTRETMNEVELLIMVTPELIDALEPHEVPPCGPGQATMSPNDWQLYSRSFLEVPGGCPEDCQDSMPQPVGPFGPGTQYEEVQPQRSVAPASATSRLKPMQYSPRVQAGQGGSATFKGQAKGPSSTESSRKTVGRDANAQSAAYFSNPSNPSTRNNPAPSSAENRYSPNQAGPGFIGPVGYDVTK